MELINDTIKNTISLFSIMNPLSAGAVMLSLLEGEENMKQAVNGIARRNTMAVFISMLVIILIGSFILDIFEISTNSIKVIGGVILFLMAINMVQGQRQMVNHTEQEEKFARKKEDISIIPLGIPIIIGPGMMATLISMRSQAQEWPLIIGLFISVLLCTIGNYLVIRNMVFIQKMIGVNGLKIFSRIMGLIVGAISAQFIISGIKALWIQF
jgi:multiple antibiotic resistance protein